MDFADWVIVYCYALGSIGELWGVIPRWRAVRKPGALAIGLGFVVHTLTICITLISEDMSGLSRGQLLQMMAWSLILVYCVAWWRFKVTFLGLMAGPLALLLFFSASLAMDAEANLPNSMPAVFFFLHLAVLFLNVSLITLGFGSALFFLNVHGKLKAKASVADVDLNAPALSTLERINGFVVIVGFPLFTIGLLTGFIAAYFARHTLISADPKEVASVLLWLLYALIFLQRMVFGWKGKRGAILLIVLFLATIFSILGVNFFMDSHHNFFQTPEF